jgi:enterochelin esterase-like enzyme
MTEYRSAFRFSTSSLAQWMDIGRFSIRAAQVLLDRAIARGTVRSFILLSVDMTTQLGASWFVNSPVTGNWEDFVVQELVPYVDASFRTIPTRNARGLVGHHMGAYGAIRIGMKHADVFGSIYGMNPVGTGFRRADYGFKASRRAIRSSCALVASSEELSRLRSLSANSSSSR